MPDTLRAAFQQLNATMKSYAGTPITYQHNSVTLPLIATQGVTDHVSESYEGGVSTAWTEDFILSNDDLVINGVPFEPQRGDLIKIERDGVTRTYRVVTPLGGNCFKRIDHDTAFRIYTDMVKNGAGPC